VVELLLDGLRGRATCTVQAVTLTTGHGITAGEGCGLLVPKKELVGSLQVLLQTRRLQIASTLAEAPLLVKELENFRVHVTLARNDSPESWREGQHDDLVLAAALAGWMGERALPPLEDPAEETAITRLVLW
jgi:hypothetical protein